MQSLAAEQVTHGPWWGAPAIALAGIVVGFVLKAVFDILVEKQRHAREDRLRFLAEKTRIYAEFGFLCSRIEELWHKIAEWEERREQLDTKINELQRAHLAGTSSEEVSEIADLRADVDEIIAGKQELQTTVDEHVRELSRLVNLIAILAPWRVRAASGELAFLLTDEEDPDPDHLEDARSEFFAAARADLGVAVDGEFQQFEPGSYWRRYQVRETAQVPPAT